MRIRMTSVCMLVPMASLLAWMNSADAAATSVHRPVAEVFIPNSRRIAITSKVNGHRYSIRVALPFVPAPSTGYSVLYVIDGDWYFGSAAEAARHDNAPGTVVVAIGYPDDSAFCKAVLQRRGPIISSLKALPCAHIARE